MLQRWNRVREMDSPAAFTYTIALNVQRNRIRHLKVRARRTLLDRSSGPVAPHHVGEVVSATGVATPGQRAAVLLVEWLGFSASEAGAMLRISPSSVRSRIHRAKATLQQTLGSDTSG